MADEILRALARNAVDSYAPPPFLHGDPGYAALAPVAHDLTGAFLHPSFVWTQPTNRWGRGPNAWAKSSSIPDLRRMMLRINDRDVPFVDGSLLNPPALLEQKTDIFEFEADLSSERSSLPLRTLPHVLSYVQRHVLPHQWQNLKQNSLKRTSERRWLWPHENW